MDLQKMSTADLEALRLAHQTKRDELLAGMRMVVAELDRRSVLESARRKLDALTPEERAALAVK